MISGVTALAARAIGPGLALLLAGAVGTACSPPTVPPPPSTPPEQVVQIYLQAAKAQLCSLTAALTLRHTWSWCRDPRLLDYRSVGPALAVPASEAGRDEDCVSFEMDTRGSSDGSMPVGWQPWSLCLVRTAAGWRLYDQGQG
ncbi:MAG TPA: hypothetical protein VFU36_08815 [Jatrophihabitans sp.]|nr:hypothetical protein [Jatrophihabitans sp.]